MTMAVIFIISSNAVQFLVQKNLPYEASKPHTGELIFELSFYTHNAFPQNYCAIEFSISSVLSNQLSSAQRTNQRILIIRLFPQLIPLYNFGIRSLNSLANLPALFCVIRNRTFFPRHCNIIQSLFLCKRIWACCG